MKKIRLSMGLHALVDDEDFERVNAFKWSASLESRDTKIYAVRTEKQNGRKVKIRMHRFIMGLGPGGGGNGLVVDHLDHDALDNRKCNLEVIDQRTNMLRSAGWKRATGHDADGTDCPMPGDCG